MKRVSSGGFTIVESMIVLGVTGVLFISMAGLVSGQQAKARFKSAMTDITTQLQSQINEVATGYYPSTGNLRCFASGGNIVLDNTAVGQGQNADCTFLGRAVMYGMPGTDPQEYKIQTLVGLRKAYPSGSQPTTLQEAGTRALAPSTVNSGWPDGSTTRLLMFGTELAWMRSLHGGVGRTPEFIVGLAIVSAPNQQVTFDQNNSLESGTVIPTIIPIPAGGGTGTGASAREGVDKINAALGSYPISAMAGDGPVELCFRSGTTNQSGLVTVGSNNSTTSIEFTIHNNQNCA